MKVAIIGGSGKMGRWFTSFLLKEGKEVVITGRNAEKLQEAREQTGAEVATIIEAVKTADIVIISVPIDTFESVVQQVQPYLRPEQIVIDVTSVKTMPVDIMHKYIKTSLVLGLHPMFGPGAIGITNQNFVLTPTNEKETALANKVKQYLEIRGARATLMTPQEHDKMMALVLGLSHFIALVTADTMLSFDMLKQTETVSGTTYRLLAMLVKSVVTEEPELYASIQMNLPHLPEIEALFLKNVETWAGIVKNRDSEEFVKRMNFLKERLQANDPDYKKAYQDMYRLLGKQ